MSKHSEAGKGSGPRKMRDDNAYSEGHERIFGKRKKEREEEKSLDNLSSLVDPAPDWDWPDDSYTNN